MILLPLPSPILHPGDHLVDALQLHEHITSGDILVLSSKAVATVEGAIVDLSTMQVTDEARVWSEKTGRSPAFCQAVMEQTARSDGRILHAVHGALLTEVRPRSMTQGTILVANAGLDESNVEAGWAVGWPTDAVQSLKNIQTSIPHSSSLPRPPHPPNLLTPLTPLSLPTPHANGRRGHTISQEKNKHNTHTFPSPGGVRAEWRGARGEENRSEGIALIISDSSCSPRRRGVTAIALACCGMDPFTSTIGNDDLYGRKMTITVEATADQLATAANMLMGNAAQAVPAVIIRDHELPFSDFCGWVPGIEPNEDLFGVMGETNQRNNKITK